MRRRVGVGEASLREASLREASRSPLASPTGEEKRVADKPLVARASPTGEQKPLVARASPTGEQKRLVVRHRSTNLRKVLLHNGIDLYNGGASFINCRGIGTCGTCAVKVEGEVSPANWRSKCEAIAHALPFSYIKPTFSVPNSGFRRCESNKI